MLCLGSVLGPLIVCLYINDLPEYVKSGKVILYADDTTILVEGRDPVELELRLGVASYEFARWCDRNRLIVNLSKTTCLQPHSRKTIEGLSVTVNGHTIECSDNAKLLGVHIDANMSWDTHVNYVCGKLSSAYWVIFQMKSVVDQSTLMNIYYALAYSFMSYSVVAWGNATGCERILVLQKRVLRLVYNLKKRDSCRPIFKTKRVLTFPSIYIYISASCTSLSTKN